VFLQIIGLAISTSHLHNVEKFKYKENVSEYMYKKTNF